MDLAKEAEVRRGLKKKGVYPLIRPITIKVRGKEPQEVTGAIRTLRKDGKKGELPHLVIETEEMHRSYGPGTRVIGG